MAYAYALSPGKEKSAALNNVRSGYKECTETLCGLEVQLEQLIGTLSLEMKGRTQWNHRIDRNFFLSVRAFSPNTQHRLYSHNTFSLQMSQIPERSRSKTSTALTVS